MSDHNAGNLELSHKNLFKKIKYNKDTFFSITTGNMKEEDRN